MRLLDTHGPAGCSVRAVAAELGVTPMALYWHVPNKEALLEGVLDAVLAEVATDDLPADPYAALAVVAHRYRAAFHRHPHAAGLLAGQPMPAGPAAAALRRDAFALLHAAGLDDDAATCAYLLLNQYLMGWVLVEHAGDALSVALDGRSLPHADARFEFGLRCLLAGLAAAG